MGRKRITEGPIGNGWIEEVKTTDGTKFVARWQRYVADPAAPGGRRRENGGYYDIGPKTHHGPEGLKSKKDAIKKWLEICDSVMGRKKPSAIALKAEKTFRWWALEDPDGFMQRRRERWAGSTPAWFEYIMGKILPRFGDVPLEDLREQDMQAFLNELADKGYSRSVVKNSLLYLRAVLEEAFTIRILDSNPAARLVLPRNTRKPQREWLSVEQFQAVLAATVRDRDRLMMRLLYIGGLRRGELLGLQWKDVDEAKGVLNIARQILSDLTVGPAKTDGSIAPIPLPAELVEELKEWRKWCPDSRNEAWVFSSERKSHINPGWWRREVLVPAGRAAGIDKLNYHMFRRGFATEANRHGIGDKLIQGQLRHASVNTTRDIYMQTVPEAQRTAVEEFAKVVRFKRRTG